MSKSDKFFYPFPASPDFPADKVVLVPYDSKLFGRKVDVPDGVWMTGAPQFWAQDMHGDGVKVGVIDTGIDHTHPSLAGRLDPKNRRNYVLWDNVGSTEFHYHGTHVAGTIAANATDRSATVPLVGVAPAVTLRDYRVFDKWGFPVRLKNPEQVRRDLESGRKRGIEESDLYYPFEFADIAQAVRDAVTDGCDVINMSLGGPTPNPEMLEAIKVARENNVAVIVAAGNEGPGARGYPASFKESLSVAAVNIKIPSGTVEKVWFSNTDSEVDVAADGFYLFSTVPGGGYAKLSGTSMATPCVAGMSALLVQSMRERNRQDGKDTMPDVHDLLRHRAVSVFDDSGKERNEVAGHGVCTFFTEVPSVTTKGQWLLPNLKDNQPKSLASSAQ